MPVIHVHTTEGKTPEFRAAIREAVARALVEEAGAPDGDRLTIFSEHEATSFTLEPHYPEANAADCVFIQIVLNAGRTTDTKRRLFTAIAAAVSAATGVAAEGVIINLVEVVAENWSFGRGEAQWAPHSEN